MESGLFLLFWYGILHAFGPDHLTAIADFSIGKGRRKTLFITLAFAVGHGVSLFLFAKLLQMTNIPAEYTAYADTVSSGVIFAIGAYLLFMAATDRINIGRHMHEGKEHIHIWFGKSHDHSDADFNRRTASALTVGALMGIGGVRGMLVTLSAIAHNEVGPMMVVSFTLGVMVVFMGFGYIVSLINDNLLTSRRNVRAAFATAGALSLVVGTGMMV
ncbi:nickel and cobalt efflux transporter rcnA [Hydrogenimonas sp.]|nr:nickel and cobalt efflux transporter rcnA [Hydrogenimonas sp.]